MENREEKEKKQQKCCSCHSIHFQYVVDFKIAIADKNFASISSIKTKENIKAKCNYTVANIFLKKKNERANEKNKNNSKP